ncbi:MAG TPA: hypothetical protein VN711_01435, partial [Candidatus Saccharimonadales bacterium]|nr:hypothetical protein [Candidatus Saccharimonadales bacterium]
FTSLKKRIMKDVSTSSASNAVIARNENDEAISEKRSPRFARDDEKKSSHPRSNSTKNENQLELL